jgi:hypothetical protein
MLRRASWLLWAICVGCAAAPAARVPDPALTTQRFAAALREDKPDAAYALLDPELRSAIARERFMRLWRENRSELAAIGEQMARTPGPPAAHAHLALDDGERVALVLEDGRWRLAGGVLDAQALDTPIDAVLELRRALQRQSLPGLLRVLARERRAAWLAAFEKSVEQTTDPLDLRVEVHDDEAVVHLNGGGEIHLRREAGEWHVWDVR